MNDKDLEKYLADNPAPKGGVLRQFLDNRAIRKHDKKAQEVAEFLTSDPHPAVQARNELRQQEELAERARNVEREEALRDNPTYSGRW